MRIERETVVILVLIALVLLPMWYLAVSSATSSYEVTLDQKNATIAPTETFMPTPAQVDEYVAGVIVWVALLVLVGMIFYTHRFIRTVGRATEAQPGSVEPGPTPGGGDRATTDGGPATDGGATPPAQLPSYLQTATRRVLEYWPARYSTPGVVSLTVFAWASVAFAALFGMEALTWSRRQYLGVYAGMMFLSMGILVAIYATWFMPSVVVVEEMHSTESADDASIDDPIPDEPTEAEEE